MSSLRLKYLLVLGLLALGYCVPLHAEEKTLPPEVTAESCLASDATRLARAEYLRCEQRILADSSGSGGYFLGTDEMQWIRAGRSALKRKGVKFSDNDRIHAIFGNSLYNASRYADAFEEYKLARFDFGMEISEWMILNSGLPASGGKVTPVKAKELPPEDEATRTCTLEAGGRLYIGLFKGGIYSYDRKGKRGELLYQPDFQYDWPVEMKMEGQVLATKLRNDQIVQYNLATNEVSRGSDRSVREILNEADR